MQYVMEITVPKNRVRELDHLAGIAAAELALALQRNLAAPSLELYEFVGPGPTDDDVMMRIAFVDCGRALDRDEVDALREKIEGARGRKEKRCRAIVLARVEAQTTCASGA